MKRNAKIIILSVAVLLLIFAFYIVNKQPSVTQRENGKEEIIPDITVRRLDEDIVSMTLINSEGEFSFAKGHDAWTCGFRNGENAYGNTVASLESMLKTTLAVELIEENASSLSKYGLEKPEAVLKGVTESGKEYFVKVGNSIVGSKYYFTVDDKNVYTVSADEGGLYFAGMSAFVNLSITSLSIDDITKLVISNGELIAIEKKETKEGSSSDSDALFSYAVTSPVTANAAPSDVQSLFESVTSIGAKGFVPDADEEDIGINYENYFEIFTAAGSIKCSVGDKTASGYYVKKAGESGAYIVDSSLLEFMKITPFDIVDKHISIHYISEVSSVEISGADVNYKIILGDNPSVNGREIDSESATDFYRNVISLCYDGSLSENAVTGERELVVTLQTAGGAETIEFIDAGAINYEVRKNGVFGLTIQRKYVDKLLKLAKEL